MFDARWASNWFSFGNQLLDHKHINLTSTILSSAMNTEHCHGLQTLWTRCVESPRKFIKMVFFICFWCLPFNGQMFVINIFLIFSIFLFSIITVVCVRDSIEKCASGSSASGTIMRTSYYEHDSEHFSLIFQFKHCADGGAWCWLLVPSTLLFPFKKTVPFFRFIFFIFSIHSIYKLNYGLVNDVKWIRWPTDGFICVHSS